MNTIKLSLFDQSTGSKKLLQEFNPYEIILEDLLAEMCSLQMELNFTLRQKPIFADLEHRARLERPSQTSIIARTRNLDVCHLLEFEITQIN